MPERGDAEARGEGPLEAVVVVAGGIGGARSHERPERCRQDVPGTVRWVGALVR